MPLTLIPTPIGNLEDITLRSLRVIENSDIILCEDTRVTKRLLSLLKDRGFLSSYPTDFFPYHSHNEDKFLENIQPNYFDKNIIYLSDAGMPGISDPGASLINYAQNHDISYDVLPGASAFLLAYVMSGFDGGKFSFYGFLPHKGKNRESALETVLASVDDIVLYESPHRLQKLIDELATYVPNRKIFMIKEATKLYQKHFLGTSLEIQNIFKTQTIKGEWVVVIQANETELKIDDSLLQTILSLNISKKDASVLLAKLSGEKKKYWYDYLLGLDEL